MKPVADMERAERCPSCDTDANRQFVPHRLYLSKTAVQHAEYNPGLGCVTKNAEHRREIAKQKGLVEVGNDFKSGESMVDHFDKERAAKLAKRWEDI